ncbi:hypothetical protein DFQ29_001377 [Apophysomyces sp. BC1021]|nr:hypothetical protein DFQ29_001377 [Apophysomyces sp. BC1021]
MLSNLSTTSSVKSSLSTASFRSFISRSLSAAGSHIRLPTHKRVMPTAIVTTTKEDIKLRYKTKTTTEPTVHYNGPFQTLEQLPEEKLAWIKQESSNLGHPLANCTRSVVMHKPHIRSQTFDVEKPTTATLTVYAQIRSSGMFNSRTQDKCIGKEAFKITMCAQQKQLQRFVINDHTQPSQSNAYQVLVVYGTFVSRRAQTLLNNTTLLQDFVTIYVRGRTSPRWDRYWAVLRGVQLELYDFQYRESRPPRYIFPLQYLVRAVYPAADDEAERQVDIGSRGLALEFSEQVLDRHHQLLDNPEFECRMYLLPDTLAKAREWEKAFTYVTTIFHELQQDKESEEDEDDEDDLSYTSSEYSEEDEGFIYESDDSDLSRKLAHTVLSNHSKTIPSKFLW